MLRTFRDLLIFAAVVAAVCVIGPRVTVLSVIASAKAIAAGNPFCIDIPRETDRLWYTAPQKLVDLGALRMRAHRDSHGLFPVFHAVLFVEEGSGTNVRLYNWSYRQMRFMPVEGQGHTLLSEFSECERRPDFIEHLLGAP